MATNLKIKNVVTWILRIVAAVIRTLFRQWKLVFAVGAANQANGHHPSSLMTLWRNWRQYSAAALSYPLAD
jgi:hypothetical protein